MIFFPHCMTLLTAHVHSSVRIVYVHGVIEFFSRTFQLSEEQLYQLHELMQATREIYDPEKAMPGPPPAVGVGPDDGSNGSGGRSGSSSS